MELSLTHTQNQLDMIVTVRTATPLTYLQVVQLQKNIVNELQEPVSLKVNQIFADQLDPLVPPTATATRRITETPSPSPTITPTLTPTPTTTPTQTPTAALVQVAGAPVPRMQLYQSPGGPAIGPLRVGQSLSLLYEKEQFEGVVWVQVRDQDGRIGWIPEIYLRSSIATPGTALPTVTP